MVYARKSRSRNAAEIGEVALAIAGLAAVIAFSLLVDTSDRSASRQVMALQSSDEIYTGSILFVPYKGNVCRQNLIDNRTGMIRENGTIPCNVALSQSDATRARTWSAARVDAIREGFSKR